MILVFEVNATLNYFCLLRKHFEITNSCLNILVCYLAHFVKKFPIGFYTFQQANNFF